MFEPMTSDLIDFLIDPSTLEGLGIFSTGYKFSLYGLISRPAHTTDSREILKAMLRSPIRRISGIYQRQEALKFILKFKDTLLEIHPDDTLIYACRDYLNSNIVAIDPGKRSGFLAPFSYKRLIPQLREGLENILLLVKEIKKVLTIDTTSIPRGLHDVFSPIIIFNEKFGNSRLPSLLSQQQLRFRLTWAALIRLVYEVNPLKCPDCGGAMKIVSLIDHNRQPEIVEKILKHCNLRREDKQRAPPVSPVATIREPSYDPDYFDRICG